MMTATFLANCVDADRIIATQDRMIIFLLVLLIIGSCIGALAVYVIGTREEKDREH
jgi:hypothetical protein